MTEKELRSGTTFEFDNEEFNTEHQRDDLRTADVWFEDGTDMPNWAVGFKILFNGKLIHSTKTFSPMKRKLGILCEKWNLKLKEEHEA